MPRAAKANPATSTARGEPAPVVALVGADGFLQQEALVDLLAALGPDAQRSDVDGPSAEASEVFDEVRSFAMFGGRRVVVVRDADAFITRHREALEDYTTSASPGNVLVLRVASLPKNQRIYKAIDKIGGIVACEPPKAATLPKWIVERGKQKHGLAVSVDAAWLLADLVGVDLGGIDNELGKLALQSDDGRVTPDQIAGGVAFRREQQMWTMTDALSRGEPDAALRTWRQLLATDPSAEFRAVTWLGLWLEKAGGALALSRQGVRPFEIAKRLRIWPANQVDGLLETASALGPDGVRRLTDKLAQLDYRTKTGLGDARRAVESWIAVGAGQVR